jgi:spermidine/putrescine ABC transporter ATP-binding subunit
MPISVRERHERPALDHQAADPNAMSAAQASVTAKGAISLRAVTKRYGEERVVDNVSLDIRPGEFFSLLGPSGSGKTTTLMMIAGFASVDEGQVEADGVDIAGELPQKRGFGMVFQNYAIFPHLNVFENVAFPLRARGVASEEIKRRVAEALALVRLERFGERFGRQLSGGQQQRVAIARAIVFDPKVVLMDEPLGALDKNLRYQMQVEIKDIQRRLGMTVVYVTHDQEEAMNMSDRIGIMNGGRVEQVDTPLAIYEEPTNTFIARFLGQANLIEGELKEISGGVGTFAMAGGQLVRARVNRSPRATPSLFVRPERISLYGDAETSSDTGINRATGYVRRMSFLGNIVRYAINAHGAEFMVDVQNSGQRRFGIDEPVALSWAVNDSLLLEKSS